MITTLKKYYYRYKFYKGLEQFRLNGKTSISAYSALRQLFVMSRGKFNDQISNKIAKKEGKYENLNFSGILNFGTKKEFEEAVEEMKLKGYYIFKQKLSEDTIKYIYEIALNTPCNYLNTDSGNYEDKKVLFDENNPLGPRYEINPADIINELSIQSLIFDSSLLAFAQEYLGVKPILDLIAFWWSLPYQGKGKSAAAQMYHFDLDRIKFMKFFFYLTDVDTDTGPHCYVKGSHKTLPKAINRDGRFTDEEIENIYGSENLIEICGNKGTIMAVDTRGFHKGKELLKDKRLLFQIEFANSMFGQTYPPINIKFVNEKYKALADTYDYTYGQILVD